MARHDKDRDRYRDSQKNRDRDRHRRERDRERGRETNRGREAEWPSEIPALGWKDIAWRLYAALNEDRVLLVAAGVTFYLLLALFPALAAFVSVYGIVLDPQTIADQIAYLGSMMPPAALEIIQGQLQSLAQQDTDALGIGFLVGLGIAIWGANSGIKALFDAMNIAYGETEKRGFIKLNLISLAFTLAAIVVAILLLLTVGVVPAVLAFLNIGSLAEVLIDYGRWPLMLVVITFGISVLYRFGPSREDAKWRWLTWGSGLAAIVWVAASWGFSWYLQNFADYNATYGSLGAVIGLLVWTWISMIVIIMGAEINAEMEHQTARDSTTGRPEPLGSRGAHVADTVGKSAGE
jgi:membrane protein